MLKQLLGALLGIVTFASVAQAQTCPAYSFTLTNGTTADASQVMSNFNSIRSCANSSLVASSGGTLNAGTLTGTTTATSINAGYPAGVASTHGFLAGAVTSGFYAVLGRAAGTGAYAGGFYDALGNICTFAYGSTGWSCSSDARLKTNIAPISGTDSLTKLALIKGVNFSWKADPSTGTKLGIIAQDVLQAFPQAVTLHQQPGSTESFYGVNNDALLAPLISGTNELNQRTGFIQSAYGTNTKVFVDASGNIGIGTPSPTSPLTVNGTIYATGGAGALSDRRHKTSIAALDVDALDLVGRLKPVSFLWKSPQGAGMAGRQIGFIAQDIEAVIPEAILTMDNAEKTLGLKYEALIPILTKALQQEQAEVVGLTAAIHKLEADNTELRQKVETIAQPAGFVIRRAEQ